MRIIFQSHNLETQEKTRILTVECPDGRETYTEVGDTLYRTGSPSKALIQIARHEIIKTLVQLGVATNPGFTREIIIDQEEAIVFQCPLPGKSKPR